MEHKSVKDMWNEYLLTLPNDSASHHQKTYTSWAFGSNARMAKQLADLVLSGKKTSTL